MNNRTTHIYLLTSTTGETYIGRTMNLKRRITAHKSTYMKGKTFKVDILQTIENSLSYFASQDELRWMYTMKPTLNRDVVTLDKQGIYRRKLGVPKLKKKNETDE